MKLKQYTRCIELRKGESRFAFLPSGDVRSFTQGDYLVNGFLGTQKEGSANNIWLRVYDGEGCRSYPLLGIRSGSRVSFSEDRVVSEGEREGVSYRVTFFAAAEGLWFWKVELCGSGRTVDLVYGQDIGVGIQGGVLNNELYMAQYLGHTAFETENGWVLASRQNQPQADGQFPYLQQGMACGRAVGYSTDGTQFFGLCYKDGGLPAALSGDLENRNKQFELSYTALQCEKQELNGSLTAAFYGLFRKDHPDAIRSLEFREEVKAAYAALEEAAPLTPAEAVGIRPEFGEPYASPEFSEEELAARYPCRRLMEEKDGRTWSFFTGDHAHVVLKAKELAVERPHGTILTTLVDPERVSENLLTTSNYIYGLFNAQTVVGNTSFHKLISTQRGLLNILKNNGQRLYVKLDGQYRLLTLPAAYEMGMNYSRWLYRIGEDVLRVTAFTAAGSPTVVLQAESEAGRSYDLLLTTQLVLGDSEFFQDAQLEERPGGVLRLSPDPAGWANSPYPDLCYEMRVDGAFSWSDDRIFFADGQPRNGTLLTVSMPERSAFAVAITGYLDGAPETAEVPACDFEAEKQTYLRAYSGLTGGFSLDAPALGERAEILNETVWWYTHNALVHFAVPHGLEQPGGAAWGTRDICQGPFEYFLTTQHLALARDVLLRIFAHQQSDTGEWPQWFMFDRYTMDAGECHGDVVFWPLKCVADYLAAAGDDSVLGETLPYTTLHGGVPAAPETLSGHIRRAVESIRGHFLDGTRLISYAGGDWDDTLQPADPAMKEHMVSAWTQALAYQTLRSLGEALRPACPEFGAELGALADGIAADFTRYLIRDGQIAGFAFRNEDGSFRYMLHPSDSETGIHCRLLPLTRSIIAELVGPAQADENRRLIDEKLKCPDGVRLMDRPSRYDGGVSHLFQRAEQAANVGREISLQYTHAHIRYIEAMAKLGRARDAWHALFSVNPILLADTVPNAAPRQSNLYFSSSDGNFLDRYQYSAEFGRLFDGSIAVKGGWRLYSSGPGIYMARLIRDLFGLRFCGQELEIDPVLPPEADGARLTYCCFGKAVTFVYRRSEGEGVSIRRNGKKLAAAAAGSNPYRSSGVRIPGGVLREGDILEICF